MPNNAVAGRSFHEGEGSVCCRAESPHNTLCTPYIVNLQQICTYCTPVDRTSCTYSWYCTSSARLRTVESQLGHCDFLTPRLDLLYRVYSCGMHVWHLCLYPFANNCHSSLYTDHLRSRQPLGRRRRCEHKPDARGPRPYRFKAA